MRCLVWVFESRSIVLDVLQPPMKEIAYVFIIQGIVDVAALFAFLASDDAAFITGQSPFRTGLLKVGLPGAKEGLQAEDPTIAELLKPMGYRMGRPLLHCLLRESCPCLQYAYYA